MDDTDWEELDRQWEERMAQEAKERAEREAVRQAALADLTANKDRRDQASAELDAAREDLAGLLMRGRRLGLDVSEMALVAGVSRDTAHRRLREVRRRPDNDSGAPGG